LLAWNRDIMSDWGTCPHADCCFSELALNKSNLACWSSTKLPSSLYNRNATCSHHDIIVNLALNNYHLISFIFGWPLLFSNSVLLFNISRSLWLHFELWPFTYRTNGRFSFCLLRTPVINDFTSKLLNHMFDIYLLSGNSIAEDFNWWLIRNVHMLNV
jgi:hypothetical protein